MKIDVFERLLNLNRGFEKVIGNLKHFEGVQESRRSSFELYTREIEEVRASVNRYVAEMIEADGK